MQQSENPSQDSRIKRGKDEDRFYCPYPGCTRSFAELWRLKVHYRAPPDVRGSGKERGHGTELQHCPKCGKELKPGKHHVGCYAGRSGARQAVKRPRDSVIDEDALRGELAAESRDATSKQRSRHNTLPELKFEDVLPHTSSLNAHSQQAAAANDRNWQLGLAENFRTLQRDSAESGSQQRQSDPSIGLDFDWQPKDADSFAKYQAALPPLQRPAQHRYGMPSAPSPPAIPPDFPGLTQPLFNFPIFDHDRTRGRNTRLPVAVTSTLLANPESDDLVLQLLGDAQSYAASGTNQLPVNEGQRQQVQSALAQQRIQHLAASAQERLRVQNPSFPQSASQNLARPHYNSESSQHDRQTLQRLADMLQPPTHTIETIEHYEPQGSGRPSRTAAQQSHSYQPPSHNWVHRQVLPRQTDLRPGLTRLTPHPHPHSPVHSLNTNRQLDVNVDMPWMDLNTWGRLPADIEQKHQQQQQEQQRQQQQHRSSANAHFDASMPDPRSTFSNFAALHSKHELVSRHSTGGIGLGQDSRHYPQSTGTVSEHSASDAAAACCSHPSDTAFGYHARPSLFDAPHSFFQAPGPTPADVLNFPEPFAAVDSGNDAVQTFPHRWRQELQSQGSQGLPQQQSRQNPFPSWANQSMLHEQMGQAENAPTSSGQHTDYFRSLGTHDPLSVEALHSVLGPNPQGPSPEQSGHLSTWFSPSQRELLEQLGQYPKLSPFDQLPLRSPLPAAPGEARAQPAVKLEYGLPLADKP